MELRCRYRGEVCCVECQGGPPRPPPCALCGPPYRWEAPSAAAPPRRSVSPSCYRGAPRTGGEHKRRVRARSESEKTVCMLQGDSCKYGSCCWSVLKRPRGSSPPPPTHSPLRNGNTRNTDMGEWNVGKKRQPSGKVRSRLQAIRDRKMELDTCSTASDLTDDELSEDEDVSGKVEQLSRDSDSAVDQQECLTSDSGPSVTSTSDTASLNGLTSALSVAPCNISDEEALLSMLRPSLFPLVPPYLRFLPHSSPPHPRVPPPLQKHLRWKVTTITPVVVRKTLTASGFRLLRNSTEWIGTWGKHMKSLCFKTLRESQKMNHFPGTFQIGRKDRLWRNLQRLMHKYGQKEFGIMPKTYVLPHDLKALKHDWEKYAAMNEKWIIKPPASARGTGIKVVSRWSQVPKRRPVVVQRYISRPLLIHGSKFDMRLYVLVTSIHPLRIYLYPDGLARFASVKYSEDNSSLHDRYMHLTNYSINRLSKSYTHNQDAEACQGHKWTLQALLSYLRKERGIDTDKLWSSMKDLVIKTILSGESSISCLTKANIASRFNCYELFGIDVLLDENLKPWLLEVNISPSLHSASPLDLHVKGPLVATLFNMVQFHIPEKVNLDGIHIDKGPILHDKRIYTVHLSKEEKLKHAHFTELVSRSDYLEDILRELTPDDVRHLLLAEDELTQRANLERIFPTPHTHHYLSYLAGPRYYNRLFDAWETCYAHNRKAGIKRLQELCERGVHLQVPPLPAKNEDEDVKEQEEEGGSVTKGKGEEEGRGSVINPMECVPPPAPPSKPPCSHLLDDMCLVGPLLQETHPLQVQQHA